MKRLILILSDYAGAGKTTLAQCFDHYLNLHRVPHHNVVLTETIDATRTRAAVDLDNLRVATLISHLDQSDLAILEIETGMIDAFVSFYFKNELPILLTELGFELTVVVPVTSDEESFDAVTNAAEIF
ncbi:MAG: hypothetical protein ACOYMN_25300, partial [Roseimicrobium sp.]